MFYSSSFVQRMGAKDHFKNRARSKSLKNRVNLLFFILYISSISVYAQDIITLRNGNEIKAKVTEITPSEIKYKRFENLEGPTVTVAKADVFAINYENGTREVINMVTSSSTSAKTAHYTENSFGIYVNPGGFISSLCFGPMIGAEITRDKFIIDFGLSIPTLGLIAGCDDTDNKYSIGLGAGLKYYNAKPSGGFYAGVVLGYYTIKWTDEFAASDKRPHDDMDKCAGFLVMANVGYKFLFSSGMYLRTGFYLGTDYELAMDAMVGGMLDFGIGIKF